MKASQLQGNHLAGAMSQQAALAEMMAKASPSFTGAGLHSPYATAAYAMAMSPNYNMCVSLILPYLH